MDNKWWKGKWEFWDIGRGKAKATIVVEQQTDFLKAVRPYLASREIDFDYDAEANLGTVLVGGFRDVGKFKRLGDY